MQDSAQAPRIVTAILDASVQERMDALRETYFPPERLLVGAHLTLFHAIPPSHADLCRRHVEALCASTAPMPFELPSVRLMGRGVAVLVSCAPLVDLHSRLKAALRGVLTPQDQQKLWPHITVANKMAPDEARQVHRFLRATWVPAAGEVRGLAVWRYMGGPWEHEGDFLFGSASGGPA